MTLPTKTIVTQITTSSDVTPAVANQPHLDLEATLDSILSYLQLSFTGYFETDTGTTTGLTFGYEAGVITYNNTHVSVVASTIPLSPSTTNYVEVDKTGTVSTNTSGYTIDRIPLWTLVTDGSSITTFTDVRTILSVVDNFGGAITFQNDLIIKGNNSVVGDNSGDMEIDALTGAIYFANNSGNGQVIVRDGAGGTANQIILDGNAGSITVGGDLVWSAGNDGSGSGLDADLIDGVEGSQFLRTDADGTTIGALTVSRPAGSLFISFTDTTNNNNLVFWYDGIGDFRFTSIVNGTVHFSSSLMYDTSLLEWQIGNNQIWHAGNDGTGSGLDADLIDGVAIVGLEKIKVTASDTLAEYLEDTITVAGNLSEVIAGDNSTLSVEYAGLNFITPVTITSSGATQAWVSFDCTAFVSSTATHAVLEVSAGVNGGRTAYLRVREDSGSDDYVVLYSRATARISSQANQVICPIDTVAKTFEWTIETPGFNDGCTFRLVGYL